MSLRLTLSRMVLMACLGAAGFACSGGDREEDAAANKAAPSGPAQNRWVRVGIGGCEGDDYARSDGDSPQVAMCDRPWVTAVCWDGETHRNGGEAWCTYKTTPASQCTDGTRGVVYTCEPGADPAA